jgi:hypothetical protein
MVYFLSAPVVYFYSALDIFAGSTANYFSKGNIVALFRRELRALGIKKRFQI